MLKEAECARPDTGSQEQVALASLAEGSRGGRGTVARNAFHLLLGQVTTTVLGIVLSAALGRTLGPSDLGLYFLIGSFSGFAYMLVDGGQQTYVTREIACQPERSSHFLGTALVLRAAGAALVAVPCGLAAWALGFDAITCWYTIAFFAVSFPSFLAQSFGMVFRARDRMSLDACVSVASKIALLGFTLAALALGKGLPGVLAAQALAGFLAFAVAIRLYSRVRTGPLRYTPEVARKILAGGGAVFTAGLVTSLHPTINALMLSKLATAEVVGWYAAANTVLGTLIAPSLIIGAASFPRLSRAASSGDTFRAEALALMRPVLWLGALASIGTFLFADDAIAIIYGQRNFGPSAVILKVFAPGFFLLFVNVLFFNALYALGRPKTLSVVKVASLAIAAALNLLLIPVFQERMGNGGIGVVAAFLASEFVIFVAAIFLLRGGGLGLNISVDIARVLGSAALTSLLLWWMPPLHFWVGVPVCVIAFLFSSVGLGLVRRGDIRVFQDLLRKK